MRQRMCVGKKKKGERRAQLLAGNVVILDVALQQAGLRRRGLRDRDRIEDHVLALFDRRRQLRRARLLLVELRLQRPLPQFDRRDALVEALDFLVALVDVALYS